MCLAKIWSGFSPFLQEFCGVFLITLLLLLPPCLLLLFLVFFFPLMFLQLLAFHPSLSFLSSLNVWLYSQVHFIFVKDPHCPSSSVCAHVTISFSTTFLLLSFLLFFILCGSAPLLSPRLPFVCNISVSTFFLRPLSHPSLSISHFVTALP